MTADVMAAIARLNAARPDKVKNYKGSFFEPGTHHCIVTEFDRYGQDGTLKAKVSFKVERSTNPAVTPGSIRVRIFELTKAPYKPGMTTPADEFVEFLHKLTGTPFNVDMSAQRMDLMGPRFGEQLLRGMRVICHGSMNKKGTYCLTAWDTVPQTQADISALRAQLDQTEPLGAPQQAANAMQPPQQTLSAPAQGFVQSYAQPGAVQQQAQAYWNGAAPAPIAPPQAAPVGAPSTQPPPGWPPGYPYPPGSAAPAPVAPPQIQPPPGWPPGYPYPPPGAAAPAAQPAYGAPQSPLLANIPGHNKP